LHQPNRDDIYIEYLISRIFNNTKNKWAWSKLLANRKWAWFVAGSRPIKTGQ